MPKIAPSTALTVVAFLLMGALTACASSAPIGALRQVDGGTEVIVPALWADGNTGQSGIEPAKVWVDSTRTSDQLAYDVNLADVQAKGGGAMWQAATSAAAAIGSLFSGMDPNDIACKFDITGPIDGPSAGAVLTVGVLAAINQHPLNPSVTMTGTISPDGSIGPVGLVGYKLRAAAEEGLETVLLPSSLTLVSDPDTGEPVSAVDLAARVGVAVVFVSTLDQAYEAFTGERLAAPSGEPTYYFSNFPELDEARTAAALDLQQSVGVLLESSPGAPQAVRDQLANAQASTQRGDVNSGFALAVDALNQFATWRGETEFTTLVNQGGVNAAREQLRGDVAAMQERIDILFTEALERASSYQPAQSLAFPGAVAWLTYARAILVSLEDSLSNPSLSDQPELLADYAGLAEQVSLESEAIFPAALLVIEAVPADGPLSDTPVNAFVSGYTNFLIAAGDANLTYLLEVAGVTDDELRALPVTELLPVAAALADETREIEPGTQDVRVELEQSSVAMTYYVVTTSLVSAVQVFGSIEMWLNPEQAQTGANAFVRDSISESGALTANYADQLLGGGLNAGFPLWSAEWGTAAFETLSDQGRDATGASIALNELWYDVITVLTMNAYLSTASS